MSKKIDAIKEKYLSLGVQEKNFIYACEAVKGGKKREMILKNLTSDVRKENPEVSEDMLIEMFKINGGEFKYENRGGYLYSTIYLIAIVVLGLLFFTINDNNGRNLKFKIGIAFILFLFLFIKTLAPTIKGKFRE
jgi:hypothetical protein